MRTSSVVAIVLSCATGLAGCKPARETNPFPYGDPPETYPKAPPKPVESADEARVTGVVAKATPKPSLDHDMEAVPAPPSPVAPPAPVVSGPDATSPSPDTASPPPDAAEPPPPPPVVAPTAPTATADGLPVLDAATRAALAKRPTNAEKLEARRLNGDGVKLHKKRDYAGAIRLYLDALAAEPQSTLARYNLACAYALTGDAERAIHALLVHRELGHKAKLEDARVDEDFAGLRDDVRFRTLTGYATIVVYSADQVASTAVAELRANLKKSARFLVTDGGPIEGAPTETSVYYQETARPQGKAIADTLGGGVGVGVNVALKPMSAAPKKLQKLAGKTDVVIALASAQDVEASGAGDLSRFYDRDLKGRTAEYVYDLRLKSSGFFVQKRTPSDRSETLSRTGRFKVDGAFLALDYKEVRETASGPGAPEPRTERVTVRPLGEAIEIDGVRYTP